MALTAPEWLTRHGGELKSGIDGRSWFVIFRQEPQYVLKPAPVSGRFGCSIMQTTNGRWLPGTGTHPNAEDALRAGLEQLRQTLGW